MNRNDEDLLFTAAKHCVPAGIIYFLDKGIKPTSKNTKGVSALDMILKNQILSDAYHKWEADKIQVEAPQLSRENLFSISNKSKTKEFTLVPQA
jgi:hypothetical protein